MHVLYLTDRLSVRGGADQHLLQVMTSTARSGARVVVAYGRHDGDEVLPEGVVGVRIKGLASAVSSKSRLGSLEAMLEDADVTHIQNVMNPVVLAMAVGTGRCVVTVQDHRFFCPGMGKTLPGGLRCETAMSPSTCETCLPDRAYRDRMLNLTTSRRDALRGARLLVLSQYMASELDMMGLTGSEVLSPWVSTSAGRDDPGFGFLLGGRLVKHKGVLDGYRAWQRTGTEHPLRIAGEGPLECALDGTERLGWLSKAELRRRLSEARALLFPSFWQEPFGILALESLAEGTPVIVAESGGTSEWSSAGCVTVPAGDVTAMAGAIRQLSDDPERAVRLGVEGRETVARRFSRSFIEPKLLALYHEVVEG